MIGLVLAGGQSKRFGQDKACYYQPGKTVNNAALAVSKLTMLCDVVFIAANSQNQAVLTRQFQDQHTVTVLTDQPAYAAQGPLSGLYAAAFCRQRASEYLLLAVDYPNLRPATLAQVASQPNCYAATPGAAHYTIAHFTISFQQLRDYLLLADNRLGQFLKTACGCRPVTFPATAEFQNLNYPEENRNANQRPNE
ncbi:molybdenum cofactor guanylyltransferase [uncultured Secundilactobacillus sp.]|uniref:molybdenum cofactor guanylyltransferase n=1 Tax=uncultured Secundilactobacillus sp. TaxID=2813935 RepID=UPI0025837915|nr:molybdenum cofactor guanylyltransferase [uncultured Secundilactobacillus sp.]